MTTSPPPISSRHLAALIAGLTVGLGALVAVGPEIPGPPAVAPIASWRAWEASVGPAGVVMAAVRGLALAAAGYLLVVVTVELVGRRLGRPGLVRAGRRLWVPWVRAVLGPVAGAGLLVSVVATAPLASATDAVSSASPVVMHQVAPPPATPATGPGAPPVMAVVDTPAPSPSPTPPTSTSTTVVGQAGHPGPPAPVGPVSSGVAPPTEAPAPATWTIQPGDHLWRVAATTLVRRWGTRPTDAQVLGYLDELVAANRDRLVVAGDPDLVYPGQVFVLPAVPAAPA